MHGFLRRLMSRISWRRSVSYSSPLKSAAPAKSADDWYRLSLTYGNQRLYQQAADAARRAIEVDARHIDAWRSLVTNLSAIPEMKAEELNAKRRLAQLTNTSDDWSVLGRDLLASGQYRQAIEAATASIDLNPSDAASWRTLAISHDQLGEEAESIAAWDQLRPLSGEFKGEDPPAARHARNQVRVAPGSPRTWKELAIIYGAMRRNREAVSIAEEALRSDPTIHHALVPLVEMVLNRVPDAASTLLTQMMDADPHNAQYVHFLGVAGAKANKGDAAAIELIRTSTRLRPREPQYWYALGRALEDAGSLHHDEALRSFTEALQLNPQYRKARLAFDRLSGKANQ